MYQIGILGSAGEIKKERLAEVSRTIGREIAKMKCLVVTGGSDGLAYEAAIGAKSEGGTTLCISPAKDAEEHEKQYKLPTKYFDIFVYTGFGYKGRNVITVRSCDAVIVISGNVGTLNEITIAYDEGKPIGIVSGSDGVADEVKNLVEKYFKQRGAGPKIIYGTDPKKLVEEIISLLN